MNICIVCADYPNKKSSTFSFVKQFVDEVARLGNNCFVLSPFSVSRYMCFNKVVEKTENEFGGSVTLIRPNYISFSTLKIGGFSPTEFFQKIALKRAFSLLPVKPDIVYGHFWSAAYSAFGFAKRKGIPIFVASGESSISSMFPFSNERKFFSDNVSGIIYASKKNRDEANRLGFAQNSKYIILPNAINPKLFYRMNKFECRKKYGYPHNAFIVAFTGWFDCRKGSKRVSEAIKKLNNPNIYSIFVGNGLDEPDCPNILFKGNVKHTDLCPLLNCADVFVLPTLAEGCCNAIIEAMACGLPIVSSDCDFNDGILDNSNSIRVNPNSIDEIAEAIKLLYENKDLRRSLGDKSLEKAAALTIESRAKRILEFITARIGDEL